MEPRWREGTLGLPRLQPLRGLSPPTGMHAQALTTPCAVCQWLGACRGVEETALSSHPLLLRGGSSIWAGLWAGLSGAALGRGQVEVGGPTPADERADGSQALRASSGSAPARTTLLGLLQVGGLWERLEASFL